jgi:uncharacterized protein DUF5132
MAIEDIFEGNLGTGLAVGLGVAVLGPLLRPVVAGVVRPAVKAAIRGGIYVYDSGREMMAQANEKASDMVAEVRNEMETTSRQAPRSKPHTGTQPG